MKTTAMRAAGVALACLLALSLDRPASGYLFMRNSNDLPVRWLAGSPGSSWDNANSTLFWRMSTAGFPHAALPPVNDAGGALANGFQTIEDIANARINFRREANTAARSAFGDGLVTVEFCTTIHPDFGDLSGAFAVMFSQNTLATGAFTSGDILFSVDIPNFQWSVVAPGQPDGWYDVEVTLIHEALHLIGLDHSSCFFAGVYQFARDPEVELLDRCYTADDRNGVSHIYPITTPVHGAVTGTVSPVTEFASVVLTDGNGRVQATSYTNAAGQYDVRVPPGTYSVTAHHLFNAAYTEAATSSGFINSTTSLGVNVTQGGTAAGVNLTLTAGTPTMKLYGIGISPVADFQALFLNRNSSQTARLMLLSPPGSAAITTAEITSVLFGAGITSGAHVAADGGLLAPGNQRITYVTVSNVAVDAAASPGLRSVEINRTGGERMLAPGYVFIRDVGGVALSGTASPGAVTLSTPNHVMLEFQLAATAVEDVRVRQLTFDVVNGGGAPAIPAVRLWRDANANGTLETGTDTRIMTSAAWANDPPAETIAYGGAGDIVLNNIGLSILAGQTATFFLTFDIPAAGSGDYTVSLVPADFSDQTHGMFYGDFFVPTGTTVSGGVQSIGSSGLSALGQFENIGGTPAIAVGGSTATASVVLRGTVSGAAGNLSLDVEVKPLGVAFNGAGLVSSTPSATSPLLHEVIVTPLTNATSYHWRARTVSSTLGAGAWSAFGANLETATDFSVDGSVVTLNAPGQLDGALAPLAIGGTSDGVVYLEGQVTNAPAGPDVALQVEIVAAGAAFTGTPLRTSAFGLTGVVYRIAVNNLATGDYRWRARGVNEFGTTSAWNDFGGNGTAMDFHVDRVDVLDASGGCVGQASTTAPWAAAGLLGALLLLACGRRGRKPVAVLIALLGVAGVAAAEDSDLPVSLSATWVQSPPKPWLSLQGYLGLELLDLDFDAVGADLRAREIEGRGLATLGVEGLIHLGQDFRIGAVLEVGAWGDTMVMSAGPVLAWRFASSRALPFKPAEMEHYLKVGGLFRTLDISESEFGDFKPTFGFRGGYEMRLLVGDSLQVAIGLDARYSPFEYDEPVVSGDTETGGFGLLLSIGLSWLP